MCSLPCRSGLVPEQPNDPDRKRGLVVLPIDPYRVHVYWTIDPPDFEKDHVEPPREAVGAGPVLRFHRIPDTSLVLADAVEFFDVSVELDAPNWYVQLPKPSGRYLVELGLRAKDGWLEVLARSDLVQTPPASPSEKDDERLMLVMGDYLLPDPFPGHGGEQPTQALSLLQPKVISGPSAPSTVTSVSTEAPLPLSPPERQPLILNAGRPDGTAHPGAGIHPEGPEAGTVVGHHLGETDEGAFAGGLSSIQLGAGRRTR